MSVFISDIDTAKLYVQCFRPLAQCAVSLKSLKCYYNKTLEWCLRQLKNKGKVQLGNLKSGRGSLREVFITKFKGLFTWSGGPRSSGGSFFCFVSARA